MANNALDYLRLGARGLILEMLPRIITGMVSEQLKIEQVDVKKAVLWVNTDEDLLKHIKIQDNPGVRNIVQKLGIEKIDDSWVTTSWLLESLRTTHPALYSLFMGWPDGRKWCDRQILSIRKELDRLSNVKPN